MKHVLVAGGGIGGLAAALACGRAGWGVQLLEQANAFAEVGAGIQLGPNAVRLLDRWGLGPAVRQVAACPQRLQVRDATDGRVLGSLRLGRPFSQRYGSDYLTLHRADLHHLLLQAAQAAGVDLRLQSRLEQTVDHGADQGAGVSVACQDGARYSADALIGCDGLWSRVRQPLLRDGPPGPTGHLAYRAMLQPADLPAAVPRDEVSVWMGRAMHAVAYPVRAGALFNVVVIVQGQQPGDAESWNHEGNGQHLLQRLAGEHRVLQALVAAAPAWALWVLHDRTPLHGPQQMAQGRMALLGDAAHPMRPYLAQGAAMALEDAQALGLALAANDDVPQALQAYAAARWRRNARVQAAARRNGRIFHASGPLRWARNQAMAIQGERLLDTPWLYR